MHYLGGKLITLERRAYLVGDAFDQRYLMFLKSFSGFTPNEAKQSKGLTTNSNGRDECGSTAEY
jgi:hypothetical protein